MKFYLLSITVALISLLYYFNINIVEFISIENCEQVKKFTYWPIDINDKNNNDNLRSVKRVLGELGYNMVNGTEEHWDIMWSFESPFEKFPEKLANSTLKRHQKINHFPGTFHFTNELELVTNSDSTYILPSFKLPRDAQKFKKFITENPETKIVEKNYETREVRLLKNDFLNTEFDTKDKFLQAFLGNPLLIDGHAFDIGIHILIASIEPLVIYRYKPECIFQFCSEPYHPLNPENTNQYVIGSSKKYAWDMKTFQQLGDHFHFFNIEIFKHFLTTNGHDMELLWKQIDDAVSSIILSKVNNIIKEIKDSCTKIKCTNENFFELLTFNFMIDDQMKVYLMEINKNPNFTLADKRYERNAVHYEQVVYNTLRLIGAEGFVELREELRDSPMASSSQNIAVDIEGCSKCINNCESQACELCAPCISDNFQKKLHHFYREHLRRGEFKRIFPTIASVDDENLDTLTESSQKLALWLEYKCEIDEDWC